MGEYNPHLPQIAGNEWVPIQQPSVKLQRNVNNQELGVGFTLDNPISVTQAQFYTGQDKPSAASIAYNQVNVYPTGQEALSGPIRKVVIPVRSASVTGAAYDVIDNITSSFCQNGSVLSGPGCDLTNALAGYGLITFRYTGNPSSLQQYMAMSFSVNDFEPELSGKRILNVSMLTRGSAFALAADDLGLNNITVPLQKIPGDVDPVTFIQVKDLPGAALTILGFTGPTASDGFYSPLGTGALTLANTFPDPTSGLITGLNSSVNMGDVTQLWSSPLANDLNYLPWNFAALSQFDDRNSFRRWIHIGTQIPRLLDGGAVSGTGRIRLTYVALEVTYCEETRVAVGGRKTEHEPHEVITQATSTLHTVPLHVPLSYTTTPVPISAGNYTLSLASVNPGAIAFAPTDIEYPNISTTRPLNELPAHPMSTINIPFPLDETALGKTFTKQESTNGVMLSLLDSDNMIRPETHVYGRQVPGLVYGDFVVTEAIVGIPPGSTEWPWIRFWARRFGDTNVPLTVSCNGQSASITPSEFDSLSRLTTEGWKEVTLRLSPSLALNGGLYLPGNTTDYASTPDVAALDITGDIDIRADVTLDHWTGSVQNLVSKWLEPSAMSYALALTPDGRAAIEWTANGTTYQSQGSEILSAVPGQRLAIRATLDVNNGAGGANITFYTAPTIAGPWVQHGSTLIQGATTSIFSGTAIMEVGTKNSNTVPQPVIDGIIHAIEVRNGIDGPVVANPNFAVQVPGTTSFTDSVGRVWTVNGNALIVADSSLVAVSSNPPNVLITWSSTGELAGNRWEILGSNAAAVSGYVQNALPTYFSPSPAAYSEGLAQTWGLNLHNSTTATATTPDAPALDITGDIDVRAEVTINSIPGARQFVGKYGNAGNRSWFFYFDSGGLNVFWSNDGTTQNFVSSSPVQPITVGKRTAVRWTMDVDNGAGQRVHTFYTGTSVNGPWTQISTTTTAGTTSIFNSTAQLIVGAGNASGNAMDGILHAVQIRNGINGTIASDVDFTQLQEGTISFAESSGLVWTLNGDATPGSFVTGETPVTLLPTDPDVAVFLSQEVPPITGFVPSIQVQSLSGIGQNCGVDPCCIPAEMYFTQLDWSLPAGTNYAYQDLFDRTETNTWGQPGGLNIYTPTSATTLSVSDGRGIIDTRTSPDQTVTINNVGSNYDLRTIIRDEGGPTILGMRLPGVSGASASTPDTAALDIVGDIDIRADITPNDWTPSGTGAIVSKWSNVAGNKSFVFNLNPNGTLGFAWSNDGTAVVANISSQIQVPHSSERLAVRVTFDVNNGAGGNVVTFYTAPSLDGTWTQLGTAVTTAGVASIFSGNLPVEIGSHTGGTASMFAGIITAAQIRNSINGTIVANPDFGAQALNVTTFADSVARIWTLGPGAHIESSPSAHVEILGRTRYQVVVRNINQAPAVRLFLQLPGSTEMRVATYAISDLFTGGLGSPVYLRYMLDGTYWKVKTWSPIIDEPSAWQFERDLTELDGVFIPGAAGPNYVSTPDNAALDITGDIDLRVEATLESWSNGFDGQTFIAKFTDVTPTQRSYLFGIQTSGAPFFVHSSTGVNGIFKGSTAAVSAQPGQRLALRVTFDVDDGAGNNVATFYTSDRIDGVWTRLGNPVSAAGVTSIFNGTLPVEIGAHSQGVNDFLRGIIHSAEIRNGIAGTVVANPDFAAQPEGTTSFTDDAGRTWTNQSSAVYIQRAAAVATQSDIDFYVGPDALVSFSDLEITPPQYWFGATEIQRRDEVETEWKTILKATNPALTSFNDYEARPGIVSEYQIRRLNVYQFPSEWSPAVSGMIPAPGVVTNECLEGGHLLLFTSNERQDGSMNLAYSSVWMERQVDENFTFPEAGFVELQPMYDRDFYIAFRPLERGGEQFSRTVLVQAAAIPPETLADFTSLRDMAWEDVNYVCVRDEDGNRWLATVQVPNGNVLRNRRLYLATVNISEVTDTPTPVDPSPWS